MLTSPVRTAPPDVRRVVPLIPKPTAAAIIGTVLAQHHTATAPLGSDVYGWTCRCGDRQPASARPTSYAPAWRAARHHVAEKVVAALGGAYGMLAETEAAGEARPATAAPSAPTAGSSAPVPRPAVYSTSDPNIVAAYRRAIADRHAAAARLAADLIALGAGPNTSRRRGTVDRPDQILAVQYQIGHVPHGWQIVPGARIQPRPGRTGAAARAWLADHQPVDVRHLMAGHGLPREVRVAGTDGARTAEPDLFEYDGTVWAWYEVAPGGAADLYTRRCTWQPRGLAEFRAAQACSTASGSDAAQGPGPSAGDGRA